MSTMDNELRHYFEYSNSGVEIIEDGLIQMSFGEYLVENNAITRHQLLSALQLQDKNPGVRLGECLAALGVLPYPRVEDLIHHWKNMDVFEAA